MEKLALKIERLLLEGKRPRDVITALGVTRQYVGLVRKKIGMPPFRKSFGNTLKRDVRERVLMLKQAGYTYKEIGDYFGFSRQRAQCYISKPRSAHEDTGGTCSSCGTFTDILQRHHINYVTCEIMLVCQRCHRKLHKGQKHKLRKPIDYQI